MRVFLALVVVMTMMPTVAADGPTDEPENDWPHCPWLVLGPNVGDPPMLFPDCLFPLPVGNEPTEDCYILIIGVMKDPPFLDPIVRPECIPDLTEPA